MRKQTRRIVLAAIAAAALLAVAACGICFFSPGIHLFGGFVHFDIQTDGYIIDPETTEILGQTQISLKGRGHTLFSGAFRGEIAVATHKNTDFAKRRKFIRITAVLRKIDIPFFADL